MLTYTPTPQRCALLPPRRFGQLSVLYDKSSRAPAAVVITDPSADSHAVFCVSAPGTAPAAPPAPHRPSVRHDPVATHSPVAVAAALLTSAAACSLGVPAPMVKFSALAADDITAVVLEMRGLGYQASYTSPCHCFFHPLGRQLPPAAQAAVRAAADAAAAAGWALDSLQDGDAAVVNDTWAYKGPGSLALVQVRCPCPRIAVMRLHHHVLYILRAALHAPVLAGPLHSASTRPAQVNSLCCCTAINRH